jgi:hypothetical protein
VTRLVVGIVLGALVAAGCSSDDGSETIESTGVPVGSVTSVASDVPTSAPTAAASTSTTTDPVTTTTDAVRPTTEALSSTTPAAACDDTFSVDRVSENFPQQLSGLVGRDIRTGAHPCFERVVIELQGTGDFPGYRVEYVPDPVRLSPSDLIAQIEGDATLVVSVGAWMSNTEGEGYAGPQQIVPTNVQHIVELRLIENFEGMSMWAIGLDEQRGFRVSTLLEPPRIVVDVAIPSS